MPKFIIFLLSLLTIVATSSGLDNRGLRTIADSVESLPPPEEFPSLPAEDQADETILAAFELRHGENCELDNRPVPLFKTNAGGKIVKAQCGDCGRWCVGASCCCQRTGWLCSCGDQ